MSRRSTPERLDAARHAGVRNRLIGDRMSPELADAWLEAWVAQAAQGGVERDSACWQAGWDWITAQRQHRAMPQVLACVIGPRGRWRTLKTPQTRRPMGATST